jgi:hypothetical protein
LPFSRAISNPRGRIPSFLFRDPGYFEFRGGRLWRLSEHRQGSHRGRIEPTSRWRGAYGVSFPPLICFCLFTNFDMLAPIGQKQKQNIGRKFKYCTSRSTVVSARLPHPRLTPLSVPEWCPPDLSLTRRGALACLRTSGAVGENRSETFHG